LNFSARWNFLERKTGLAKPFGMEQCDHDGPEILAEENGGGFEADYCAISLRAGRQNGNWPEAASAARTQMAHSQKPSLQFDREAIFPWQNLYASG
jgi:hypothetical protein